MHTKFRSENLTGLHHSEDLDVDEKIVLEWILGNYSGNVWTGFIWLMIRTSGRIL
jgi:hypothetical protein